MDQLQLPQTKLLYIVSELWKTQKINDDEKAFLKEMIINDEPEILEIIKQYESNHDENILKENIINIVRPKETKTIIESTGIKQSEQDDLSSPLGNRLLERKKRHKKETRELEGLAQALRPTSN